MVRAAAARGTAMGLSSFASKPIEEVVAANPQTFFQIYWIGSREQIAARVERARAAGAVGLIVTLDWSFSHGRDWAARPSPRRSTCGRCCASPPRPWPAALVAGASPGPGNCPDLTTPNMVAPGSRRRRSSAPTASGCRRRRRRWDDVAWLREQWGGPFMVKGVTPGRRRRARGRRRGDAPSRCRTTAATTSTARPPRSARFPRSPPRSATGRGRCSTAASAGAATWSRPSRSAPGRDDRPRLLWGLAANGRPGSRTSSTCCAAVSSPRCSGSGKAPSPSSVPTTSWCPTDSARHLG